MVLYSAMVCSCDSKIGVLECWSNGILGGECGAHHSTTPVFHYSNSSLPLRSRSERLGLERSVAHLQILSNPFVRAGVVERFAQFLAQHDVRRRGHLFVIGERVA